MADKTFSLQLLAFTPLGAACRASQPLAISCGRSTRSSPGARYARMHLERPLEELRGLEAFGVARSLKREVSLPAPNNTIELKCNAAEVPIRCASNGSRIGLHCTKKNFAVWRGLLALLKNRREHQ